MFGEGDGWGACEKAPGRLGDLGNASALVLLEVESEMSWRKPMLKGHLGSAIGMGLNLFHSLFPSKFNLDGWMAL